MNKQLSIYLDLLRFLASLLVYIAHASSFAGGWLWQLGRFGHEAVVFFFILSGFVIAFVCFEKKENLLNYTVNRMARIYSVAFPALFITGFFYYLGHLINPESFIDLDSRLIDPFITIISAILFLNQSWVGVTIFSNMPYWSLGYEVLYYVFFGVLIYSQGYKRFFLGILVLVLMGPSIFLYLPIWFMGVVCFKALEKYHISLFFSNFLLIVSILGLYIFSLDVYQVQINSYFVSLLGERFYGILLEPAEKFAPDYILAFFVTIHIFSISNLGRKVHIFTGSFEKIIRAASAHTFSIYLFHMPILFFVSAVLPYENFPEMNIFACWGVVPVLIILLSYISENRKNSYKVFFRKYLEKIFN